MEYLIVKKKLDEKTTEKLIIPAGDSPETNPAGIKKLAELKRNYSLKEMAGPKERAKISEEMAAEERKLKAQE